MAMALVISVVAVAIVAITALGVALWRLVTLVETLTRYRMAQENPTALATASAMATPPTRHRPDTQDDKRRRAHDKALASGYVDDTTLDLIRGTRG